MSKKKTAQRRNFVKMRLAGQTTIIQNILAQNKDIMTDNEVDTVKTIIAKLLLIQKNMTIGNKQFGLNK